MRFIEIEQGVTINSESIAKFEEAKGEKTRIKTMSGDEYVINFSYENFKNLISQTSSAEKSLEQLAKQYRYPTP